MKTIKILKTGILLGCLFGFSNAHALLVTCPAVSLTHVENVGGTVSAVSDCQYITPASPSNTASITNINTAGFFGFTDWAVNGGNLQLGPASGQTGNWAISGANFANFDYMIVFKDGANTNLIGFLFNEQFSSGVWSSPFTSPPFAGFTNPKDVSHYTIAQRYNPTTTPVPEPFSLTLLGIGLAGMCLAGRRRSA